MAEDESAELDRKFFDLVGQIAHDWATLESLVNESIWEAADLDHQLGACITAQIFSLPSRLDALSLLLRARGASEELMSKVNRFIADSRRPTELRNRAVHDPLGVHKQSGEVRQLQITARGKLVFETRKVTVEQLEKDSAEINRFLDRFMELREELQVELETLPPYQRQLLFPLITRSQK